MAVRHDDRSGRGYGERATGDRDYEGRSDEDRRDMQFAYGRYSASDQSDDRDYESRRYEDRHGGDRYYGDRSYGDRYGSERRGEGRRHWGSAGRYNSGYGYGEREHFEPHREDRGGGYEAGYGRGYRRDAGYHSYEADNGYAGRWSDENSRRHSFSGGTEGKFRGWGPKGYTRTDERIKEQVCDALMDDSHIDASEIEVTVKGGEVTLSGSVSDRFAKRHAEDLAERCASGKHVQNNLRVNETKGNGGAAKGAMGTSTH